MRKDILKGILIGSGIFLTIAGIFSSCVRERDIDTSISTDHTMGEYIYTNALDIAFDASSKSTNDHLAYFGACETIVHDKVSFPRTIKVMYGSADCLCLDGRTRSGTILVSNTGNNYSDSSGTVLVTFEDYKIDGYQIFGQIAVNNKGRNKKSQPNYELKIAGKYLKPLVLDTLIWGAEQIKTHVAGSESANYDDDLYEYDGTGHGMNEYQVYYATNIISPVTKYPDCKYFKSGKIEQQPQGHSLRTIDYGDGTTCDDDATVVFNTKSYNIKL
ncbi:MAG: hypothetical protein JNM95_02220 [Chitinophagaceae bacterium]|nr:hypothetical protein [Chitinophagaceae bacterium]